MAVVSVNEDFEGRTANDSVDKATATKVFIVLTDDKTDDGPVVLAHGDIPAVGAVWSEDYGWLVCSSRTADVHNNNWQAWKVTCQYDNQTPAGTDPTTRPPEISIDGEDYEVPLDFSIDDVPANASSGEPFDPPVMVPRTRRVVEATVVMDPFASLVALNLEGTVNSDTWHGGAAKTWLLKKVRSSSYFEKDTLYYKVSFRFLYSPNDFHKKIELDRGFYRIGDDDELTPILKNGVPVSSPVLLDGNGQPLAAGENPVVLELEVYPAVSWASIPV